MHFSLGLRNFWFSDKLRVSSFEMLVSTASSTLERFPVAAGLSVEHADILCR
jgi:hypothetical protein